MFMKQKPLVILFIAKKQSILKSIFIECGTVKWNKLLFPSLCVFLKFTKIPVLDFRIRYC